MAVGFHNFVLFVALESVFRGKKQGCNATVNLCYAVDFGTIGQVGTEDSAAVFEGFFIGGFVFIADSYPFARVVGEGRRV